MTTSQTTSFDTSDTTKPVRSSGLVRLVGIALALGGVIDAAYLSWTHLADNRPALCSEGGGCDLVQSSVYSEVGGVPIALLGLAGFLVILLGLFLDRRLGDWGPVVVLGAALIGTLYSAYLTYLELFVLHAICPYCVASALFMVGLLVVAIIRFSESWRVEAE